MELKFVDLDLFEAVAERRIHCKEDRFLVKDAGGAKISITPGVTIHTDLTVLGADWIPVRADGISVLHQMTHNPHTFVRGKARNIVERGGRWFAESARERAIDDSVVLVGGHTNYYHWLIDDLPRLLFARQYGQLAGRKVLVNRDLTRFQKDTLRLLGIGDDELVLAELDESLRFAEVCVPNMLTAMTVCHPLVPTLVRDALLPMARPRAERRIYLSRQDAPTRQLANEAELGRLLERFGFERHLPSDMSLQEQLDVCASADVLLAAHGAAMANMLFCPPHARVIEIFSPAHPASFFLLLARVCGLSHSFVPAALVDPQQDKSPLHHHWEVDLLAMEQLLREQLGA